MMPEEFPHFPASLTAAHRELLANGYECKLEPRGDGTDREIWWRRGVRVGTMVIATEHCGSLIDERERAIAFLKREEYWVAAPDQNTRQVLFFLMAAALSVGGVVGFILGEAVR